MFLVCAPIKRSPSFGSGPAGLALAHDLNRRGHSVTVFEKRRPYWWFIDVWHPKYEIRKESNSKKIRNTYRRRNHL